MSLLSLLRRRTSLVPALQCEVTYLACPYSHPNRDVRHARYEVATQVAAHLMRNGSVVISPLTHGHPIAEVGREIPTDWATWETLSLALLGASGSITVLALAGWQTSVGVTHELDNARSHKKPVKFLYTRDIAPFVNPDLLALTARSSIP